MPRTIKQMPRRPNPRRRSAKQPRVSAVPFLQRPIGPPVRQTMSFAFQDVQSFSTAISADNKYTMNGMYDPRYDIGGGQPTYFVDYLSMYNKYHVDRVRITASLYSNSVDTTWAIVPTASWDTRTLSTFDAIMELPYCVVNRSVGFRNPTELTLEVEPHKIEGTDILVNYLDYSGDLTHNPGKQPLLHVVARSTGGIDNLNYTLVVKMIFYATLFARSPESDN